MLLEDISRRRIGVAGRGDAPELGRAARRRPPLGRVVGARSGDKGGNANLGVWARDDEAYDWLQLVPDRRARCASCMPAETDGLEVQRYELPNLRALNFVIVGLLGRGRRRVDPHRPAGQGPGRVPAGQGTSTSRPTLLAVPPRRDRSDRRA